MTTVADRPFWFLDFFFMLRRKGLRVSLNEWMTLVQALRAGLHDHTVNGFYEIAQMIVVKNEAELDLFDLVFDHYFRDMELPPLPDVKSELEAWLEQAIAQKDLPEELLAQLMAERDTSFEGLMDEFRKLMDGQDDKHDGGNKWIGTGGTSPFGHSGSLHQPGIRVGGEGGGRQAFKVLGDRRYKAYRKDQVLDTRQVKVALKSLRILAKEGSQEELDIDATVEATGKNAGDLELIFRQDRKNSVKVLLLMDSGGSMAPYAQLCNTLFSAAHQLNHFKDFQYYFFHNCIYHFVYKDNWHQARTPLPDLLRKLDKSYKVIVVGDACMAPYELFHPWYGDGRSGFDSMEAISNHFEYGCWLNPEPQRLWGHETISALRSIFPMHPLTLNGLNEAIKSLLVKQ